MVLKLLWVIQLAPLGAFLAIQLLPKKAKPAAPAIGVLGAGIAAAASLVLFRIYSQEASLPQPFSHRWLEVGGAYTLFVGFLADPLNLLMVTLVTTISFFVQLFSVYYMADDAGRARYFGFLSFFSFSMTGLVLSSNLLQTFLFWELVGLASYLLIGFWYEKPAAATAARKAFVMNRLGDLGFYLGLILLFLRYGTLNFLELESVALARVLSPSMLTLIGILIFMGVMGKSAQFPFHTWLPDAMEGPTPVSALIHSATMVAAGVFLLSRAFGLFSASPATLLFILTIGSLTALVGAAVATVQRDIKKILAYSTISQLGLMVMAIGAGSATAGMFHLSTHAYFKSLLFLTAGAFIHRFHTNDIWEIARKGGKKDSPAMAALCVGLFSLCGLFPFPGFFSKDFIFEILHERNLFFYAVSIFVIFLTVYYSFRMLFVLLFSKITHGTPEAHETLLMKLCRAVPLAALAVVAFFVGLLGTPLFGHRILRWLGGEGEKLNPEILAATLVVLGVGAALAFKNFRDPEAAEKRLAGGGDFLHVILTRKFFIDDLYEFAVQKIGLRLAGWLDGFDRKVINGLLVNETSFGVMRLGRLAALLQNGLLQDYLALAVGGGVIAIFFLYRP